MKRISNCQIQSYLIKSGVFERNNKDKLNKFIRTLGIATIDWIGWILLLSNNNNTLINMKEFCSFKSFIIIF